MCLASNSHICNLPACCQEKGRSSFQSRCEILSTGWRSTDTSLPVSDLFNSAYDLESTSVVVSCDCSEYGLEFSSCGAFSCDCSIDLMKTWTLSRFRCIFRTFLARRFPFGPLDYLSISDYSKVFSFLAVDTLVSEFCASRSGFSACRNFP